MSIYLRSIPELSQNDINRFWGKVLKTSDSECWPWLAGKFDNGYGAFAINRCNFPAHRIAYLLQYNEDNIHLLVCHTCDNKICQNGNHLWLGTANDNLKDMIAKGRHLIGDKNPSRIHPENLARGENHGNSILNEKAVKDIFAQYKKGNITIRQLALKHGVTYNAVRSVLTKETWKHVLIE